MALWIAILVILTANVAVLIFSTRNLVDRAYGKGFRDGVHCIVEKEYVRLDQIIKND